MWKVLYWMFSEKYTCLENFVKGNKEMEEKTRKTAEKDEEL